MPTKRKPAAVGEILTEEFMRPLELIQGPLAEAGDARLPVARAIERPRPLIAAP